MEPNYNFFVQISIWAITKIWHGKIGRTHNQKKNIVCPFVPSCSNYAILALQKYGFIKGWFMTFQRLKRCHNKPDCGTRDFP